MKSDLSIVIPVHAAEKRWSTISRTISLAENDSRVCQVLLNCEPDEPVDMLLNALPFTHTKVKVDHNETRQYVFRNKYICVDKCDTRFCLILDSDNVIDERFLDVLFGYYPWHKNVVMQPEFARPAFDFRAFSSRFINAKNAKEYMSIPMFRVMMNAMNYVVDKWQYLAANKETFDSCFDPKCADSLQVNYNLLKAGLSLYVTPDLQYDHMVHEGSFYKEAASEYGHLVKAMEDRICQL